MDTLNKLIDFKEVMSLVLYHHGGSTCAAKVRFCLAEKELSWEGQYLDILKGGQFAPEYLKLNAKAVVPTLVHDGNIIVESTVINDYLEDVFPDHSLTPETPYERAQMRLWLKALDEHIHPSFAEVNFSSCLRHIILRGTKEEVDTFLNSTPSHSITPRWHARKKELVRQGFKAPGLVESFNFFDSFISKMDRSLTDHDWLAGDTFSLADIGLAPYIRWLSMLNMDEWWTQSRPRVADWLERIRSRPTFKPSVTDWIPKEVSDDFGAIGSANWPGVKKLLKTSSH